MQFSKINSRLPSVVAVFRDGVSEGQISKFFDNELPVMKETVMNAYQGRTLVLLFGFRLRTKAKLLQKQYRFL